MELDTHARKPCKHTEPKPTKDKPKLTETKAQVPCTGYLTRLAGRIRLRARTRIRLRLRILTATVKVTLTLHSFTVTHQGCATAIAGHICSII